MKCTVNTWGSGGQYGWTSGRFAVGLGESLIPSFEKIWSPFVKAYILHNFWQVTWRVASPSKILTNRPLAITVEHRDWNVWLRHWFNRKVVCLPTVVGCPDLEAPSGGWTFRDDATTATFGCTETASPTRTWQMVCFGQTWRGVMFNCTQVMNGEWTSASWSGLHKVATFFDVVRTRRHGLASRWRRPDR